MTISVRTARISYSGADRLDITRKSGREGLPFAPSWAILAPALKALRWAEQLRIAGDAPRLDAAHRLDDGHPQHAIAEAYAAPLYADADRLEAHTWATYVPAYTDEMRKSYREHRPAWEALLARERVVLCCYCADPLRCHRRLLATILAKLGAVDEGEMDHSPST